MTSSLDQSLSKLNINAVEKNKILLEYIKNQFQQGKSVFKGYQTFCKKYGDDEMKYKDFDFWFHRFKNEQMDLDYDRSKDPKTHEFSDFPVDVVKKIVEKSGCKEKLILRKVSKGLRETVDNAKHYLNEITLRFGLVYVTIRIDEEKELHYEINHWKSALNDLANVFKWQKLTIESLTIDHRRESKEPFKSETAEEIKKILSSLNHQISTKIANFDYLNCDGLLAVLPYLKSGFLERIQITNNCTFQPSPYINLQDVIQLDQWKKAKSVYTNRSILPIESLLHFNDIFVAIESITVEEFLNMKNTFLASPNFVKCLVVLNPRFDLTPLELAVNTRSIPIPETEQFFKIDFGWGENWFEFEKMEEEPRFIQPLFLEGNLLEIEIG